MNHPVSFLNLIKSGSVEVSQNGKKSLEFYAKDDEKFINIIDLPVDFPGKQTFFEKLSHAKKFAKMLKQQDITLVILDHEKELMKIGKNAKPKLSRLLTTSDVQIMDLRRLRRLDKRLRSQ